MTEVAGITKTEMEQFRRGLSLKALIMFSSIALTRKDPPLFQGIIRATPSLDMVSHAQSLIDCLQQTRGLLPDSVEPGIFMESAPGTPGKIYLRRWDNERQRDEFYFALVRDLKIEIDALFNPQRNLIDPVNGVPIVKQNIAIKLLQASGIIAYSERDFFHYIRGGYNGRLKKEDRRFNSLDEWMHYEGEWTNKFTPRKT